MVHFISNLLAIGNYHDTAIPPGVVTAATFQDLGIHHRNIFQVRRSGIDVPL